MVVNHTLGTGEKLEDFEAFVKPRVEGQRGHSISGGGERIVRFCKIYGKGRRAPETIIIQDRYFKRTIFQFLIPLKNSCLKQQQECIMGLITISSRNKIYESSRAGKEGGKENDTGLNSSM